MIDQLVVLAEIEQSYLLLTPAEYMTPVWKYTLWITYEKKLPFMAPSDTYPGNKRKVLNVIIDQQNYKKAENLDDCFSNKESYWLEGPH